MITVTGTIEKNELGVGSWALVSDEGKTYELKNPPPDLCQSQQRAQVTGTIRNDVMSLAMIGDILEVDAYQLM